MIQSQIKRELRSLGDVLIVSFDDAQYILAIVAVEPYSKITNRKAGDIAIGSMFVKKTPDGDYYFPNLWVQTDDTIDLEGLCESLVATIDTSNLEPVRELFQ